MSPGCIWCNAGLHKQQECRALRLPLDKCGTSCMTQQHVVYWHPIKLHLLLPRFCLCLKSAITWLRTQHSSVLCCWTASFAACRAAVGRTVSTSMALARQLSVFRTEACRNQRVTDVSYLHAAPPLIRYDKLLMEQPACISKGAAEDSHLVCSTVLRRSRPPRPCLLSHTSNEQRPKIVLSAFP